jgi:hypothetical membrane protein
MTFRQACFRLGLAAGVLAPLWWAGIIVYCASQFPGYSHIEDFISELAARRAPTEALMREFGFILTGALYLVFAATLGWHFRRNWLAWLGVLLLALGGAARIGAGIYACEPGCVSDAISLSQDWHHRYATAGYWLMMATAVTWGMVGNRYPKLRHLMAVGIGAAMWCAAALILMEFHPAWQGLFQRFASGILSLWVLLLAISVWRQGDLPVPTAAATAPTKVARKRRRAKR